MPSIKNRIISVSDTTMDVGLKRQTVTLIAKPSKTVIAILKPTLSVNLSIPLISRPGNRAAMNTYPGRNSKSTSAKGMRSTSVGDSDFGKLDTEPGLEKVISSAGNLNRPLRLHLMYLALTKHPVLF